MEKIKEIMIDYWSKRVSSFSELRKHEFVEEKHKLWMEELNKYLPVDKKLKILDVGTGTGFFCFILGQLGHEMTGIDLTEGMIAEAKKVSKELNIPADFYVMDAEKLEFEDGYFDAIVSRNLTWQLTHLQDAYKEWKRVLKPGGIIVNFDADYCREKPVEELPQKHAHSAINNEMKMQYEEMKVILRDEQQPRPAWDEKILDEIGFPNVFTDTEVGKRIYEKKDEFYNPTPIFTIVAES